MIKIIISFCSIFLMIVLSHSSGLGAETNHLLINSITPLKGTVGNDLRIEVSGNGFDSTTRVALLPQPYPDYPKPDINDLNSPCVWMECGGADLIEIHENLLFLAKGFNKITIADISNPVMPVKTGEFNIDKKAFKIVVDENFAYMLAYDYYGPGYGEAYFLQIIDLTDLSHPEFLGEISLGGTCMNCPFFDYPTDLDIKDKTVYITCGRSGMRIIDASVPSNLQVIGTYNENDLEHNNISRFNGIDVIGDDAYIASGDSGMAVMNISNPVKPLFVKLLDTPGECMDVAVSGKTAYVADNWNGLLAVDIGNPSNPQIAGSLPLYGHVDEIQIKGSYAWLIAPEQRQYHMVDIRRPSFPVLVVSASMPEILMELPNDPENFMALSDQMVYALDNNCLLLTPIPSELSTLTITSNTALSFTIPAPLINARYKIRVFNDLHSAESTQTISFEYPNPPNNVVVDYPDQVIKTIPVGELPEGVFLTPNGDYAYVPNGLSDTISVIRASDNTVIKTISTGSNPGQVIFTPNGAFAYVANAEGDTVSVINTSDYSIQNTIAVGDYPGPLAIIPEENFFYVGNRRDHSISVIRTLDNTVAGDIPVGRYPYGLAIRPDGVYIYVLNYLDNSISVIRTSDNQVETTIPLEGGPQNFTMTPNGDYLYVSTEGDYSLYIIQTSENRVIKTFPEITRTDSAALTVSLDGNYVYAGVWGDKVLVIQTSDQEIVKTIQPVCDPSIMAITPEGDYLYISKKDGTSINVLRTSDNKIVKTIPVGMTPSGIAVTPDEKYVYVSNVWDNTVSVIANSHDLDNDGDGFTENQGDCNDNDPSIYPGAPEICGDGIDQDCDGKDQDCSHNDDSGCFISTIH